MEPSLNNSFGPLNRGLQMGQNSGSITAEFHLPPGEPGDLSTQNGTPLLTTLQNNQKHRRSRSHTSHSPATLTLSTAETFSTRSTSDVPGQRAAWLLSASAVWGIALFRLWREKG